MKPEFKPEFKLEPPSPKRKSPKEETLPVIYSVRMVRFPQVAISLRKTRGLGFKIMWVRIKGKAG